MKDLIKLWNELTEATKDMYMLIFSMFFVPLLYVTVDYMMCSQDGLILRTIYTVITIIISLFFSLATPIPVMYILTIFKRWWKE